MESVLSDLCMDSRDLTQFSVLCAKHLYLLSYLTSLNFPYSLLSHDLLYFMDPKLTSIVRFTVQCTSRNKNDSILIRALKR